MPAPSLNAAADDFYTGAYGDGQVPAAAEQPLSAPSARKRPGWKKSCFLQQQSQADAQKSQDYRIRGEMLLAHLHLIERGQTVAHLPNLYDPEAPPLEIAVEPVPDPVPKRPATVPPLRKIPQHPEDQQAPDGSNNRGAEIPVQRQNRPRPGRDDRRAERDQG